MAFGLIKGYQESCPFIRVSDWCLAILWEYNRTNNRNSAPSLNSRCNDKTKAVNDSYYTTGVTSYVEFVPNPKNSLSVCSNFNYSGALGIVYFLFTVWYHQTMWCSRACFSTVLKEERKVLIFLRLCLAVLTSAYSSSFMLMFASLVRTELKKAIVIY